MSPVEYLDVEDLVVLGTMLLGDELTVRDVGLLGAAAERPQTSAFGEDAYPDLWTKAAALMQSLVNGHPLFDGNKRLGWLAIAVFLELNGVAASEADNDDVYELVYSVAEGSPTVAEIAELLKRICRSTGSGS